MSCPFCSPENPSSFDARTVTQNSLVKAFMTKIPVVPGHTLLIPQRCTAALEDLTAEEHAALFDLLKQIKQALKKAYAAEGFNIGLNEGTVAGQSVPHLHLHVLPRKQGDTGVLGYDPRQFFYRPGPRDISADEELQSSAALLRQHV